MVIIYLPLQLFNPAMIALCWPKLSERLKIAEKCFKIKAEFDELEKNVEAERGKMKARANRKTGRGEL